VLLAIKVREDETVEVGAELALIGEPLGATAPGQPAGTPAEQPAQQPVAAAPAPSAVPPPPAVEPEPSPARHAAAPAPARTPATEGNGAAAEAYVTPLVRKLASEHGVDLSTVTGTGVGGRIRKQDVLEAARTAQRTRAPASATADVAPAPGGVGTTAGAVPEAAQLRGQTVKMSRLRKVIAERMVESLQTSAQLTTVVEADVTNIALLREQGKLDFETRERVPLSFLAFFAKAALEALKIHPALNASIDTTQGEITYYAAEHLGIAVDTERGLLVPVIRDAGYLNLAGLARKVADLAARTRRNQITPDELSGGTFTLTNTGSRGALFDTPIINQPQVAILGTGTVVKRPVVITDRELGEVIAIRSMVYLALTYDHQLVDGADAARFLTSVKSRLEQGDFAAELSL